MRGRIFPMFLEDCRFYGRCDAHSALDQLLASDDQTEDRQASVVDRHGGSASFTGNRCYDRAGGPGRGMRSPEIF